MKIWDPRTPAILIPVHTKPTAWFTNYQKRLQWTKATAELHHNHKVYVYCK